MNTIQDEWLALQRLVQEQEDRERRRLDREEAEIRRRHLQHTVQFWFSVSVIVALTAVAIWNVLRR